MRSNNELQLSGIRQNNLRNLNLEIPHDSLTVVTGLSGSGKSSLAFDTVYAEGGRRYIETFSPYTRQFLERLARPEFDTVSGVRPALALEQRNSVTSSRSTVGTTTEINDYLKIVWSQIANIHCPRCKTEVSHDTPTSIVEALKKSLGKTSDFVALCFPLNLKGIASVESLKTTLLTEGFIRYFCPKSQALRRIEELSDQDIEGALAAGELYVVVDRIKSSQFSKGELPPELRKRLFSSISQAYNFGNNRLLTIEITKDKKAKLNIYSDDLTCRSCDSVFAKPKPSSFSFNSPLGACHECNGFGKILTLDLDLCVPDRNKTIQGGAVQCWNTPSTEWEFQNLLELCHEFDIPVDVPWKKLKKNQITTIFEATRDEHGFYGLRAWFNWLEKKKYKMHVRVFLSRHRTESLCPSCKGTRLKDDALAYQISGVSLPEIWQMPIGKALEFFKLLQPKHVGEEATEHALNEVTGRLQFLCDVGLHYLTLDRQSRTLSGGENQRVNITTILGSQLVNTMLVLDEPSIGLHPRDTNRLLKTIYSLRDRGNTVLVVEHDKEVISAADHVIDLGPQAGSSGGEIVYQGPVKGLLKANTITAQHLNGKVKLKGAKVFFDDTPRLSVKGASANNLNNLDLEIPLGCFVTLTGPSGSGKSSFISRCLVEPFEKLKQGLTAKAIEKDSTVKIHSLQGLKEIDDIVVIDQSAVGKSPRSNPATYTKAWDIIRECFAATPEAERLGLSKSAFSFNVDGGRCDDCKGAGYHKIEMQFLADVYVVCETCSGTRFQEEIRNIRFADRSIVEFLDTTLEEAGDIFRELESEKLAKEVTNRLQPLLDLGLGYLKLGQPLSQLSGGEAQRVKLASYLKTSNEQKILFILDEPTTGLHTHDVGNLLDSLRLLVEGGHSVLCVEHNTDLIGASDWMIDLGPGGGEDGGKLILQGEPKKLISSKQAIKESDTIKALAGKLEAEKSTPSKRSKSQTNNAIQIRGARHHNLKNINLDIPTDELTVITGVSGSGKSSLAFDILFSEGQRRFIDCLSPYARQFITQLERPDIDGVESLPPTIAVSQKTAPPLGVSTIATTTEVYQYLRLLYSKIGIQHCPEHDLAIEAFSAENIALELVKKFNGKRIHLFAPVISGRKGFHTEVFNRALKAELNEARIDGKVKILEEGMRLERHKLHSISLLVASLACNKQNLALLKDAVDQCLLLGNGTLEVSVKDKNAEPKIYSSARMCPECKRGFPAPDPQDFSFRSARGMCESCLGRGTVEKKGVNETCPDCLGARIRKRARHVYLEGKPINELTALTAPELRACLDDFDFDQRLSPVVEPIMLELRNRLDLIASIGLDYLTLDRESATLSGGEAQRLRLARTLGSPLTGVCYVLDEPTIGLHPSDHQQLMEVLFQLRDSGNTVIVVEHDEETIRHADNIIDMGPCGGAQGGKIVAQGSYKDILNEPLSPTGTALSKRSKVTEFSSELPLPKKSEMLKLTGATTNNLRKVNAEFPLERMTVVTGVSGAGKSSLVHGTLIPAIIEEFEETGTEKTWAKLENHESLERFVEIDQSPIGRSPSSTPASFLKIFDEIRKAYANLNEAKARGWKATHFSFNTAGGRCDACSGKGYIKVPMSFLPDAVTVCEKCEGMRYDDETLEITFQGVSIGKLLQMTIAEVREIFANHKKIRRSLDYVYSLGLGYLAIGQPTFTLSGGEAQRLKIARELGSREAVNTLYILDEPTTGLHMNDIDKLMNVLRQLIEKGNTVVIIEHNLDVIRQADYMLEIGPGPGDRGGKVIFSGAPEKLAKSKKSSPTKPFLQ